VAYNINTLQSSWQ